MKALFEVFLHATIQLSPPHTHLGGAQLGSPSVAIVNILKSDFPNGRFAFQGPLQISLPNPETQQRTVLMIERTGGVLGQQEVIMLSQLHITKFTIIKLTIITSAKLVIPKLRIVTFHALSYFHDFQLCNITF